MWEKTQDTAENPQVRLRSTEMQPTYIDCRGGRGDLRPLRKPDLSRSTAQVFFPDGYLSNYQSNPMWINFGESTTWGKPLVRLRSTETKPIYNDY